jgi:ATP adenylyltransferase
MAEKESEYERPLLRFENARTEEQISVMKKAEREGICPFCREYIERFHPKPIIREERYWLVTENMSPYKGTKFHFLFIYTPGHVESVSEISAEAFTELYYLLTRIRNDYWIKGGTFILRFGDNKYNGGSVSHLHAQLIVGDADNPDHEPVRTKIG